MGQIQKQSIKGIIYTFGGAVLGFVISGILFPNLLSTEEIGLISVLVAYAVIFAQIASLGFIGTTTRMFSYFRDFKKNHNGFLFIATSVTIFGFILASITFFIFKDEIVSSKENDSLILEEFVFLLLPLVFSILFFNLFDHYNKVLFNAVRGIFYKEFLQRLFIVVLIMVFGFGLLSFNFFMIFYVLCYFIPLFLIIIALLKEGQLNFRPVIGFVTKDLSKTLFSVSLFSIISSATGVITLTVDKIMVNDLVGLSATGIYTTCFFFGTLVILPSRAILKTASAYIAEAWRNSDILLIKTIYYKSSLNQFMFGVLLLIGIWVNIDNIMILLGVDFINGKYVILFIGLAYLIDMLAGVSASIITNSKYYRVQSILMVIMVIMVILTNIIFIPIYGIVGAAVASLIAKLLYNLIKFFFIFYKFKMQPYNFKFIIITAIGGFAFLIGYFIPRIDNFIIDILVRSTIVSIVYVFLSYITNVADELNSILMKIFRKVINKI